jgi:hypothetical protein
MAEDWKLQVSYKTQSGDMINVRAQTADELSVLLESIADYSFQIAATQKAVATAFTLNPSVTGSSTPVTAPEQYSAPTPAGEVPGTSAPTCQHGARKYKSGVSSKTGKPYAMWVCPMPQGPDQCRPVN